jgi:hypothetical protein
MIALETHICDQPTGRVSRKWYGIGYQAALTDIRDALAREGESGVREWLTNNIRDTKR